MINWRPSTLFLMAALVAAQEASPSKSANPSTLEPRLPVIDYKACPGEGSSIPEKIVQPARIYSSWRNNRRLVGSPKSGDEIVVLSGVNVIHKPDITLVKAQEVGSPFKPGDKVLRYGLHADGNWDVWSKGVWGQWSDEEVVENGSTCGFGAFGQGACIAQVIQNGIKEWWVRVKTSGGQTGWVFVDESIVDKRLGNKGGNFTDLCSAD